MHYADFVALVERQIKSFNDALGEGASAKHLTAEARLADMREKGWGTMDAVAVMDAADFRDCGFPPGMAKLLVNEVAKATAVLAPKPAEQPTTFAPGNLNLVVRDERTALEASSDEELLAGYDHNNTGVRGEILNTRANGREFLFFVGTKLAIAESAARLAALKANRPVTSTVEIEGKHRRPVKVGQPLKAEVLKANPFRRGEPLQDPDETCSWTKESYKKIPMPVRSFMQFACERGDMVPASKEEARALIREARDPNALNDFQKRYPESAIAWDETPENKRPNGEIQPDEVRSEGRRGFPFPEQPAAGWPAGNAVRIFLYAAEDANKWVERLDKHLATLRRSGQATTWHMGMVGPGQSAEAVARVMLNDAHVVVVLTSPSLAVQVEDGDPILDLIDNLANDGGLRVVPVRAIPSAMRLDAGTGAMIERVTSYPQNARALNLAPNADEALAEVAIALGKLCDHLTGRTDGSGRTPRNTLNVADMPRTDNAAAAFEALAGLLPTTDAVRRFSWEHYKQDLADYRFASARQAVGFLSENRGVEVALRGCLIWRLCNILPASFDGVVARANVSPSQIAGAQAAQGSRAVDLVHLMSQRTDGLLTLANIVACVI